MVVGHAEGVDGLVEAVGRDGAGEGEAKQGFVGGAEAVWGGEVDGLEGVGGRDATWARACAAGVEVGFEGRIGMVVVAAVGVFEGAGFAGFAEVVGGGAEHGRFGGRGYGAAFPARISFFNS